MMMSLMRRFSGAILALMVGLVLSTCSDDGDDDGVQGTECTPQCNFCWDRPGTCPVSFNGDGMGCDCGSACNFIDVDCCEEGCDFCWREEGTCQPEFNGDMNGCDCGPDCAFVDVDCSVGVGAEAGSGEGEAESEGEGGSECGEPCPQGCCAPSGSFCCQPPFCSGDCTWSSCCN